MREEVGIVSEGKERMWDTVYNEEPTKRGGDEDAGSTTSDHLSPDDDEGWPGSARIL